MVPTRSSTLFLRTSLGWGGDHRGDQGVAQQLHHRLRPHPPPPPAAQRAGQGVAARIAGAAPAALDFVLGDVGDLQEAGERVGEAHGVGQAQAAQLVGQDLRRLFGALAMEGDGGLPDFLDLVENRLAVLRADDVAQHPAQNRMVLRS